MLLLVGFRYGYFTFYFGGNFSFKIFLCFSLECAFTATTNRCVYRLYKCEHRHFSLCQTLYLSAIQLHQRIVYILTRQILQLASVNFKKLKFD